MAILTLDHETNKKIAYVSNKLFEIEFLLKEGPGRLEAYGNALNILKAIKRGVPRQEAAEMWQTECCPPGQSSSEDCLNISCAACWLNYIDSIQNNKE